MQKGHKYILASIGLVVTGGAAYYFFSNRGEDVGENPNPDSLGSQQDQQGTNTSGADPITFGDTIYPAFEYANLRSSKEVNDGWFNNLSATIQSPNPIGEVTSISIVGDYTWYGVTYIEEIVMNSGNIVENEKDVFVRADVVKK